MRYIFASIVGLITSVIAFAIFAYLSTRVYQGQGAIGINIASPPSLLILLAGFVAGFYLVLKFSN